jgi:hypothetical protein
MEVTQAGQGIDGVRSRTREGYAVAAVCCCRQRTAVDTT